MPTLTIRPYEASDEVSVVALWVELPDDGASNSGVAGLYQRLGYTVEERISMGKRLHDRAVPPPSTP